MVDKDWNREMKERVVKISRVYEENASATKPIVVNIGGARSSKSYSIAQLMLRKFVNERDKNFLTTKKTFPSLRVTAYRVAIDMMKDYGYYPHFGHNKSYHEIYNPKHNNTWYFISIDDPEKIKSTEYNYIHMEEANGFTYNDYMILKLRLSGKVDAGERNQMFLSLNPSDKYGWVNEKLLGEKDVQMIHSTYKDALPFLPKSYVEMLEGLKEQDESYWTIYGLGEFAELKGLIHKLEIIKTFPEAKDTIYGLDFGYVNPNVLIRIDIDIDSMSLYFTEMLYKSGMTNAELIREMREFGIEKDDEIYADSAEPARIEEIYREGFNVRASDKSVSDGINFVNRFKLYSTYDSPNVNREMQSYKRKVDKNGNVLEEPVKFEDHCPNAIRYAVYTHLWEHILKFEKAVVHDTKKPSAAKPDDGALWLAANEAIQKHGKVQLGAFAHSWDYGEEAMRVKLLGLGLREHERNRFVYGERFFENKPKEEDGGEDKGRVAKVFSV